MLRATTTFSYGDGYHVVRKGEIVASDHDAAKACPDYFEETDLVRADSEQATAAPGEKRA